MVSLDVGTIFWLAAFLFFVMAWILYAFQAWNLIGYIFKIARKWKGIR